MGFRLPSSFFLLPSSYFFLISSFFFLLSSFFFLLSSFFFLFSSFFFLLSSFFFFLLSSFFFLLSSSFFFFLLSSSFFFLLFYLFILIPSRKPPRICFLRSPTEPGPCSVKRVVVFSEEPISRKVSKYCVIIIISITALLPMSFTSSENPNTDSLSPFIIAWR